MPRLVGQQGYTFNEILVAMTIAGIGVLGYAAATATVIRGNHASANYTAAVNLAQDKMEQLRGRATLGLESRCPNGGEIGLDALGNPGGIYNRCWRITDSPHGTKLRQVEVIVTWRDLESRSVALATLVFED
jgi:hypothetical protein